MADLFTKGTAKFDSTEQYRYALTREWETGLGRTVFILLNPSTATAEENDPTVRRCIGFAMEWGHRSLEVVNAFALRSTEPKKLYGHSDPVGPENDRYILEAARRGDIIVAAWGTHGGLRNRDRDVMELLKGIKVYCLKVTKFGFPQHPLYLAGRSKLIPYTKRPAA